MTRVLLAITSIAAAEEPGEYWLQSFQLSPWDWGLDFDGDGLSTRDEYYSGTNPLQSNSLFAVGVMVENDQASVFWDTVPGVRYQLQHSVEGLTAWGPLGAELEGDGTMVETIVAGTMQREFFRVGVLEPLDVDEDGLSTLEEALLGTNPADADTDGDSYPDGVEVLITFTDPLVFDAAGGTIRGTLSTDPDGDGDPGDGVPVEGAVMFLDLNYDGERGLMEPKVETLADGSYEFTLLSPGVYHVRQEITPGVIQTLPSSGISPVLNGLPDEVVNYTHSELGALPVPYGVQADPWTGPPYIVLPVVAEEVDPAVVLEPLERRVVVSPAGVISTVSLLSLPENASILLRFDEMIIDGDGDDLLVVTLASPSGEEAEIFVGETENNLVRLGVFAEQEGPIGIDLAEYGITTPIRYLQIKSLNSGGSLPGFDLIGAEAVHYAPPRAGAHVVTIAASEVAEGIDFGRFFQDLPPRVFLSVDFPRAGGLRFGESARVQVTATDDIVIASLELAANGQALSLDENMAVDFTPSSAGFHSLQAIATDNAGQTDTRNWEIRVLNADGSSPFDPSLLGLDPGSDPRAPSIRVTSPGAGEVVEIDTPIIATIGGLTVPDWTVEYALVDDIDPYNLSFFDPDYITLATGSGYETNGLLATFPGASVGNGIYFIRISASPSGGGPSRYFGQVIAKGVDGTTLRPAVTVTSPAAGDAVMMSAPIVGSISSDRPLREWTVDIAPADEVDPNALGSENPSWKRIAEGSDTIDENVITRLDATTLKNGSYVLRIVAWNDIGLGRAEPLYLEVQGDAKLGRHKRVFTDLEINLAGFDLSILRTYDSFSADKSGDFGYGWSMGIPDPEIGETVPTTGTGFFGATPFRDGTRVYLNTPDGRRIGFTFRPEIGAASAIGAVYRATFEPDTGVYETLEIPEGDRPFLSLNEQGEASVFFLGFDWNPSQYILTTSDGKRYTYDEDAGLLEAADLNGNRLIVTDEGVRHSSGVELSFLRDGEGRITQIIDPDNRAWLYAYDAEGNLETVTDPDGRVSTYTYFGDPAHFLKTVVDPLGRVGESYEYDADGRLAAVVDAQGNRIEQTWDPAGFVGSSTNRRGHTTEIVYDERGNIVSTEDPLGNVTLFEYGDPANPDRATKETDAMGNVTRYEFNSFGDPTEIKLPINFRESLEITYDTEGRVTNFYDFNGAASTYAYDDRGNVIFQEYFGGFKETFTYSAGGRPVTRTTRAGHLTTFDYDSNSGQLKSVKTNEGFEFEVAFNRSGDLVGGTGPNGRTYAFEVDARSIPLTQTDPAGNSKTITEEEDGTFVITGRGGAVEKIKLAPDQLPELITYPRIGTITPSYDEERNVSGLEDPAGNDWTFSYDALNRFSGFTDPLNASRTLTHDAVGNIVEIIDRNGRKRTFTYDANRRVTAERWHDDTDAIIREMTYTYHRGRPDVLTDNGSTWEISGGTPRFNSIEVTYPGQNLFTVRYLWTQDFEQMPHPTSVSLSTSNTSTVASIVGQYSSGRANEFSWTHPDGRAGEIQLRHQPDGRVNNLQRKLYGGSLISETDLGIDLLNRVTSIRHLDAEGNLITPEADLTYTRDAASRVTRVVQSHNTADYTYNSQSELTGATHTAFSNESFTYDNFGNRLASHLLPAAGAVGAANRLQSAGGFTFVHDAEGNVIKRTDTGSGEVIEYGYDYRNRMNSVVFRPSVEAPPAKTVILDYDIADRLISREVDGVKTWIYYDRTMPLAEFAAGTTTPTTTYFYELNQMDRFHGIWQEGIGAKWFLHDHLGSVRGVIDDEGALETWVDYDSFGNLLTTPEPADLGPIRFAGRHWNADVVLYENRARYFDPQLGRFLQEDPLLFQGGDFNLYRYGGNNPLNNTDPTGQTAAVEYASALIELVDPGTICEFATCVGTLWVGLANSVANLQGGEPAPDDCGLKLVPMPSVATPTLKDYLTEKAGDKAEEAAAAGFDRAGAGGHGGNVVELIKAAKCAEGGARRARSAGSGGS